MEDGDRQIDTARYPPIDPVYDDGRGDVTDLTRASPTRNPLHVVRTLQTLAGQVEIRPPAGSQPQTQRADRSHPPRPRSRPPRRPNDSDHRARSDYLPNSRRHGPGKFIPPPRPAPRVAPLPKQAPPPRPRSRPYPDPPSRRTHEHERDQERDRPSRHDRRRSRSPSRETSCHYSDHRAEERATTPPPLVTDSPGIRKLARALRDDNKGRVRFGGFLKDLYESTSGMFVRVGYNAPHIIKDMQELGRPYFPQ